MCISSRKRTFCVRMSDNASGKIIVRRRIINYPVFRWLQTTAGTTGSSSWCATSTTSTITDTSIRMTSTASPSSSLSWRAAGSGAKKGSFDRQLKQQTIFTPLSRIFTTVPHTWPQALPMQKKISNQFFCISYTRDTPWCQPVVTEPQTLGERALLSFLLVF